MKTKNDMRMLVGTSVLCLLPILFSCVVYPQLPEQIAVHWNNAGEPNGFLPRAAAAFGLPFLFVVINLFSKLRLENDPSRTDRSHSQAIRMLSLWTPPVLSLVLVPVTLYISMGVQIPMIQMAMVVTGIVLMICGNYLPKCRQNYTIGIKLPWTLHDSDNWNKTHRMAGYLWIAGGFTLLVAAFVTVDGMLLGVSATAFIVILLVGLPILYSYRLNRKTRNGSSERKFED